VGPRTVEAVGVGKAPLGHGRARFQIVA
jgi:hypothetical protein